MWAWRILVRHNPLGQGGYNVLRPSLQAARWAHDEAHTPPKFKQELRRLYKLIHPDLLHNYPSKQATNLRSFQLLQEYLNAAKGGNTSHRFIYHFEFFIRRAENNDGDANNDNVLERVEVSLPPPQVKFHPQRGTEMLPGTKSAIGKLFAACGLSAEVTGGLAGDEPVSLSDFFQQASERQRQNEASVLNLEQQVIMVKNAMRMRSGITVSFLPALADAPVAMVMEALEKLAKVLDRSKDIPLSGFAIMIGDCYGIDALGNLWIDHNDRTEMWTQFLHTVDLPEAAARKVAAKKRHLKEVEVAKLMQVAMIFTHASLAASPAYSLFLSGMAEGAKIHGSIGGGKFSELPVRVTEANRERIELGGNSSQTSGCYIDEDAGAVLVPVSANYLVISQFILQRGEAALTYKNRHEDSERRLGDLKVQARKKLRLRHLTFDPVLTSDQQTSACVRLLRSVPDLLRYTEGLSLCISNEFRLPRPGSKGLACLKWDFSVSDL